jgi:hypothetical protein
LFLDLRANLLEFEARILLRDGANNKKYKGLFKAAIGGRATLGDKARHFFLCLGAQRIVAVSCGL